MHWSCESDHRESRTDARSPCGRTVRPSPGSPTCPITCPVVRVCAIARCPAATKLRKTIIPNRTVLPLAAHVLKVFIASSWPSLGVFPGAQIWDRSHSSDGPGFLPNHQNWGDTKCLED